MPGVPRVPISGTHLAIFSKLDGPGPLGSGGQKWHLQKSASDDGVKIELRPVLTKFGANLSFPGLRMRLAGL